MIDADRQVDARRQDDQRLGAPRMPTIVDLLEDQRQTY